MDNPLLGKGVGAYIEGYIRSFETPWSYELVYIALLYQSGIFGILLFVILVFSIIKKIYFRIDWEHDDSPQYYLGILVGGVCFLVAGASNPMIYYVWFWSIMLVVYHFENHNIQNDKINEGYL
ncbi:hypothetical protein [Exiguobacterium chiriqhucha]|uniref:hypothetical protein n=1 Tax=Exiguobacterium chiriqhucha TaxID=1385984 RepID=UPI000735E53F|nr:hypothetical protein [Exiguobacterium chiriqhucha]